MGHNYGKSLDNRFTRLVYWALHDRRSHSCVRFFFTPNRDMPDPEKEISSEEQLNNEAKCREKEYPSGKS